MKSIIRSVFILSLSLIVCVGCSKKDDNEPDNSNQSVTTAGDLSGTIVNYVSTEVNKVSCYNEFGGASIIGESTISSTGKFSMTLPTITTGFVRWIDQVPGVIISDTTALYGVGNFEVYKDAASVGELIKCNFTCNKDSMMKIIGNTFSGFAYSPKPVTVKGNHNCGDFTENYNFSLKKGWNEIVGKVTARSTNSSGNVIYTVSYSNDIPVDLKWKYFKDHSYNVRSNVSRLCQHKQVRLFSNGR